MTTVPEGANLGLGCGNPTAPASMKPGETVLDLGSGAGFDVLRPGGRLMISADPVSERPLPDRIPQSVSAYVVSGFATDPLVTEQKTSKERKSFEAFGLRPEILRAVAETRYTIPTPIQEKAIPLVIEGKDLIGCAQTGTGKTAAFALPILHRLRETPWKGSGRRPIRALVLTPTRELASQIAENFAAYGRHTGLTHAIVFGGVSQGPQEQALRRGIDIVDLSHVINFDLPNEPESYVHRIGRTGRAGASGIGLSFCSFEERPFLAGIERLIRKHLPVAEGHPYRSGCGPAAPTDLDSRRANGEPALSMVRADELFRPGRLDAYPGRSDGRPGRSRRESKWSDGSGGGKRSNRNAEHHRPAR